MKVSIYGDKLYTIGELAKASDLSVSIIRKWIFNGDLVHFLTIYYNESSNKYFYKLGLPYDDDELVENSTIKYKLRLGGILGESNKTT